MQGVSDIMALCGAGTSSLCVNGSVDMTDGLTGLGGSTYINYAPYADAPEEGEFDWGGFARNLVMGLAVGAACIAMSLLLPGIGTIAAGALMGAGIGAVSASVAGAVGDYSSGNVRSTEEVIRDVAVSMVSGALTGAITGGLGAKLTSAFPKAAEAVGKIPLADWAKVGLFNTGDGILGRLVYAVADGNMSVEEKFAYAFSPEHMAMDFLGGAAMYGMSKAVPKIREKLPWNKISNEGGTPTQGYSNFADGMSPEDAARYIANNEKAFFNEFSERASAAGLSDTQIAEAFEVMRNGDYAKMATYFDTSSPVDGAVFWSGNKEGAAAYANTIGGTIMEQTPGGQVFDNWRGLGGMYPEWDTPTNLAQKPIWDALSSQYANGAEGIATYVHPDGYVGKVWSDIEKPILEENDIIIQEVIIDAK